MLQDGFLILCLTDNLSYGYSGEELSVFENFFDKKKIGLKISPNPFNSSSTITVPENLKNIVSEIIFYNTKGSEVLRDKVNLNGKININFSKTNLSTGLYFLKIVSGDTEYYSKITYLR